VDDGRNGQPGPSAGDPTAGEMNDGEIVKSAAAADAPHRAEARSPETRSRSAHHEEPDPRFIREPDE